MNTDTETMELLRRAGMLAADTPSTADPDDGWADIIGSAGMEAMRGISFVPKPPHMPAILTDEDVELVLQYTMILVIGKVLAKRIGPNPSPGSVGRAILDELESSSAPTLSSKRGQRKRTAESGPCVVTTHSKGIANMNRKERREYAKLTGRKCPDGEQLEYNATR